jgi:uncharacterized protein YceK
MKKISIVLQGAGLLALCCCPMLLNGCSSAVTLYSDVSHRDLSSENYHHTIPRVYGGTVCDWNELTSDDPDGLIAIFDLPLSAAADTVTLPYTAVRQSMYGNLHDPQTNR